MTLSRLYRYGPGRQLIGKGYVVASQSKGLPPEGIVAGLFASTPPAPLAEALRRDPSAPTALYLDSGLLWLHTRRQRDASFQTLQELTRALADEVKHRGGILLPNAVRMEMGQPIASSLCGDMHVVEAANVIEQVTYCNLLRLYLPQLIAMTGRASASADNVEMLGSRRLSNSRRHFAARHFESADRTYLDLLRSPLRRHAGVVSLDLLDVSPSLRTGEHQVGLRFIDGQILWSTVRAHAILVQALLIRARRMSHEGRTVPRVPQDILERNRARVLTTGMAAKIEFTGGRHRNVRDAALELLEDLCEELQALEVEYHELAPLMLGPALRQMGRSAVQNESELLRSIRRQCRSASEFVTRIERLMQPPMPTEGDELQVVNEQLSPVHASLIRHRWEVLLAERAADAADPAAEQTALNDPVELVLDLRAARNVLSGPAAFLALWAELNERIASRAWNGQLPLEEDLNACGPVRVSQIPSRSSAVIGPDREFAIHSVLEVPAPRYLCELCVEQGTPTYSSLFCCCCDAQTRRGMCTEHAVLLDGCVRPDGSTRITCQEHAPRCPCGCGQPAAFYCSNCETAFCVQQRRPHPGVREIWLCITCEQLLFPICQGAADCKQIADLCCEYITTGAEKQCPRRLCAEHAWRWQIYGRQRPGLVRCTEHQDPTTQTVEDLVYQIVAGTAARNLRARRHVAELPNLRAVHWIFLNARLDVRWQMSAYDRWFGTLQAELSAVDHRSRLQQAMWGLLCRHEPLRRQNLQEDAQDRQEGERLVERIRMILKGRSGHWPLVGAGIQLAGYRRKRTGVEALLLVEVPAADRGHFIGGGGRNVEGLKRTLGLHIQVVEPRRLIDDAD